MNRTTTIITGLVLIALLATSLVVAEEQQSTPSNRADAEQRTPPNTRRELDALLQAARHDLAQGNFDAAEAKVLLAESSTFRYPRLHFGDTPARLRRDFDAAATKRAQLPSPSYLSQDASYYAEPATAGPAAVSNPFTAKGAGNHDIGAQLAAMSAPATSPAAEPSADGKSARELSDEALIAARQALIVGDRNRAEQELAEARALGVAYEPGSDNPQLVAEAIGKLQQIEQLRTSGDLPAWKQAYAPFLVEQASALIGWNDLQTAQRAANEARGLGADFSTASVTPEDVLGRIAELSEGTTDSTPAPAPQPRGPSLAAAKAETLRLLTKARDALAAGDLTRAEQLAGKASLLNVAEPQFGPGEDSPARLAADLQRAAVQDNNVETVAAELSLGPMSNDQSISQDGPSPLPLPAVDADYVAQRQEALPVPVGEAYQLIQDGESALRAGDRSKALELFRAAFEQKDKLDLVVQQRLQSHLQMLQARPVGAAPTAGDTGFLSAAGDSQNVLARQVFLDVTRSQTEASRIRQSDPYRSREILEEARDVVEASGLDEATKNQLLARLNLSVEATNKYISDHKAELDLDAANQAVLDENKRREELRVQVGQEVAELVDQFNKLIDEHRDAEAEVVAKKLYEMAPDELVAKQVWLQAKMIRRQRQSDEINALSEEGVATALLDGRRTAAEATVGITRDYHIDGKIWKDIQSRRGSSDGASRRSARELEIQEKLKTNVLPKYDEMPLAAVIDALGELAGVNMHLDPRGLSQEGVRSDTPVSLNLNSEIQLKSALQLILEPLHLTWQIKDEVVKITSEQIRDGDVFTRVYNVADLVIPIPNFVPSSNIGLQGLIEDAYRSMGYGTGVAAPGPISLVHGRRPGQETAAIGENVLANPMAGAGGFGAGGGTGGNPFPTMGAGGPGGAAAADFDSLIDLIVSTVEYETLDGERDRRRRNPTLPHQPEPGHQPDPARPRADCRDLLEQLRRLQDLQVTIEVRFIRLTDSLLRADWRGLRFQHRGRHLSSRPRLACRGLSDAWSQLRAGPVRALPSVSTIANWPGRILPELHGRSRHSLPQRVSFGLATQPQFGTPTDVASFGFSVLSDIEAYFLIECVAGRSVVRMCCRRLR